jgi:arsenate reductase
MKQTSDANASTPPTTLYGIPNCDTVKKARTWLEQYQVPVQFHDFKKQGLQREIVKGWLQQIPLDLLINRKGTTWRTLSEEQKALANDEDSAIELMLSTPSLIKRPVLQMNTGDAARYQVGFKPEHYQQLFSISTKSL